MSSRPKKQSRNRKSRHMKTSWDQLVAFRVRNLAVQQHERQKSMPRICSPDEGAPVMAKPVQGPVVLEAHYYWWPWH